MVGTMKVQFRSIPDEDARVCRDVYLVEFDDDGKKVEERCMGYVRKEDGLGCAGPWFDYAGEWTYFSYRAPMAGVGYYETLGKAIRMTIMATEQVPRYMRG